MAQGRGVMRVRTDRTSRRRVAALVASPLALSMGVGAATPAIAVPASDQEQGESTEFPALMLVVDTSGSMDEPSGSGGTRMEAAEDAFSEVLGGVPDDAQVGLRLFGGSCDDETRLEVPVGPVEPDRLTSVIGDVEPDGDTPLADSIEAAAADLPADRRGMIVVVTDGEETCGGDPCEVAGRLSDSGVDVRIDVVGFQVSTEAQEQLACIADAGGGTYFDAPDADALASQLRRAAVRGLRVFTASGIPVEGTPEPQGAPELGADRYVDHLNGDEPRYYEIDVPPDTTLWAAASIRPMLASTHERLQIVLEVTDADGAECTSRSETASGAWSASLPLSVAVRASSGELAACGPGPYGLRAQLDRMDPDDERAVELLIEFEPEPPTTDALPERVDPDDRDVEPTTRSAPVEPLTGSPNIASAPVVDPGRYSDTIIAGETLFYAAELDWGQQFACEPTLTATPGATAGLPNDQAVLWTRLFAPHRSQTPHNARGVDYTGDADVTDLQATPQIRYLNRQSTRAAAVSTPGTYYCAITLEGGGGAVGTSEVPLEVTIDVLGEAGAGAPDYSAEPTPTPSPTEATEEPADEPTATADEDEDSGGTPGWLIAVLAAAAALIVVVAAALWRRRGPGAQAE